MYMPFHRMKCTYTQFSLGLHFSTYTFDKFNHEIFWNISPAISKWKTLSFKIHKGATFDAHLSGKQHYWEFFLSNLPVRCPETDTGICSIVFSEPGRENIIKAFPFGGRLFLVLKISFIRWKHKKYKNQFDKFQMEKQPTVPEAGFTAGEQTNLHLRTNGRAADPLWTQFMKIVLQFKIQFRKLSRLMFHCALVDVTNVVRPSSKKWSTVNICTMWP